MKTQKTQPWIVTIFSVSVICIILILANQSFRATEEAALIELNKRQLVVAQEATGGMEMYFEFLDRSLKAIAKEAAIHNFEENSCRHALAVESNELKSLGVNDIGILDANGVLKFNATAPQIEGADFSWRRYFQKLKKNPSKNIFITQFIEFKGMDKGQKGVLAAVPIFKHLTDRKEGPSSDKFEGVVICTLKLDTIAQKFITPIKALKRGNAFMFDGEYNVLWAPDTALFGKNIIKETDEFPTFQEVLRKMVDVKSGTAEYSYYIYDNPNQKFSKKVGKNLIAYSSANVGDNAWIIGVWSPKENAKKLIHDAFIKQLMLVGLIVIVAFACFFYIVTMSFRYNKTLKKEVDKKTKDIIESHKRLLTVLNSLDASVYASEMETYEIVFANKYLQDSYGDIVGKVCWQIFQPDSTGPCNFCKKDKLQTADGRSTGLHVWEFYDPANGRWYEKRGRAINWVDGRMVKLEIAIDITDRKLADIELKRANNEMETFCTILKEIGVQETLDGVGTFLIKELQSILNTQYMLLFIFSSDRSNFFALSEEGCTVIQESELVQTVSTVLEESRGIANNPNNKRVLTTPLLPDHFPAKGRQTIIPFRVQRHDDGLFVVNCTPDCLCDNNKLELVALILEKAAGTIKRAILHHEEVQALEKRIENIAEFSGIIGKDPKMHLIYRLIEDIAPTDATVLIQGETGTGKEMVARAIWKKSLRQDKPLVVINCSAYPSTLLESELFGHEKGAFTGAIRRKLGRFEQANGGTVFLDEIGEISASAQIKLLRVIQTQKFERLGSEQTVSVNVRILAATNKDLLQEVKNGNFREDLYYRINVIPIQLPPLRSRKNDIPLLAQHFQRKFVAEHGGTFKGLSSDAMRRLLDYPWPGNVRELENSIEHAVVLSKDKDGLIEAMHMPSGIMRDDPHSAARSATKSQTILDNEKKLLKKVLEECNWNKSRAALRLGISRSTLYGKLKRYQLSNPTT